MHDQKVIHRDFKPANILIGINGIIKVTDFGLAKSYENTSELYTDDKRFTLLYCSPEQVKGKANLKKVDIWSLGVILFFMCAQKYPFDGDHPAEIIDKIKEPGIPHDDLPDEVS
jgi:serine/threonine-protein kinase